jgi:hypothetical protein
MVFIPFRLLRHSKIYHYRELLGTFYFHGVRLSPLGTTATVWPIVAAPDDRWNANWQGNRSTRRKPATVPLCPQQIPHELTRAQTRTPAVESRRLTA